MAVNESEEYLESLAQKSFLSMWSYPNLGFGEPSGEKGGKELCDLLVLFGNNLILFSDKSCKYSDHKDEMVAWKRWYKRSIQSSAKQLVGAKRTLLNFPERIYSDDRLVEKFPLEIPSAGSIRIFLVAVTHEVSSQCFDRYSRQSLKLDTRIKSSEEPFAIGCNIEGEFVHVLDDSTLDTILGNVDTINDFVMYLQEKESKLTEHDFEIHGEENLLAQYLRTRDANLKHSIPVGQNGLTVVPDGEWNAFIQSDRFSNSKNENRKSYNIDRLIEHFTESYRNNLMVMGQSESLIYHEKALRILASETRFGRRIICQSLTSILEEEITSTFWASTTPSKDVSGVRYVFVTYPEPPEQIGIEKCEAYVLEYLSKHLLVARNEFSNTETVIGIALPNTACSMQSYFVRILAGEWTDADIQLANSLKNEEGIFGNLTEETTIHFE